MWVLRRPAAQHYLLRAGRATVVAKSASSTQSFCRETGGDFKWVEYTRVVVEDYGFHPRVAVTGQQRNRVPLMASAGAEHDR
jgi:hypothetical protein